MKVRVFCVAACAVILGVILELIPLSPFRDSKGAVEAATTPLQQPQGEVGLASFYDQPHQKTASGEKLDPAGLTAAHKKLPLGTHARVTNLESGKNVAVRINDRGPYVRGRVIDLSKKAAQTIGIVDKGMARVEVKIDGQ
jgi:rare lipoprotein A